jgi:tripartite ATP-independent transporter DctM subunit
MAAARMLRALEAMLGTVLAVLLAALLALVLAAVIARYGFATGLAGTEELALFLLAALVFLGAPLAQRGALAMRLDLGVRALPARAQMMAGIMADAVSVAAGLALAFGGLRVASVIGSASPALGLPEWPRFALAGAGGALLILILALERLAQGRRASLAAALGLGAALHLAATHAVLSLPPSLALGIFAVVGLGVGAPLPHAFLAAAHLAGVAGSPLALDAVVTATAAGLGKFLLVAIPFFLLAGGLLTASGTAEKIVRFAAALVGHRRGGLAQSALLSSVLFSGASGSSIANAAFGATAFQPQLVKNGYKPAQAGAIVASASVLDNVIPPSIAFLILALAANLPVGNLFAWGFFAGGVMAACLAVAIRLSAQAHPPLPRADSAARRAAAKAAIPAFGLGVDVVLGIRLGIVTTTEAAALAALYTLFLCLAARLRPAALHVAFRQAAVEAAAIGLLIASAAPFAFLLAIDGAAGLVASFVAGLDFGPWGVLAVLNLILLGVGLVLDIGAAILIFAPILLPLAVTAGLDPVHFGVILVVNLMIGGLTPPAGILVFVVAGVTRVPAAALFRAVLPYLAALLAALGLLTAGALLV